MNAASVIVIAFLTALLTAAGSMVVFQKYNVFPPRMPAAVDTMVPDLKGLLEADARANAGVAHIQLLIASREPSADTRPGAVIRQSVPSGQRVAREYSVNVVLADDMPKVPDVTGLPVADATQRLDQKGLLLAVSGNVPNETVPAGAVVEQTPKADSALAKGGTVTVQVSNGPGDVQVPKVIGLGLAIAKANLEKLGLKATPRWVSLAETATYVVLNQKPAAGEKTKPGTEVELTVNQ